MNENPWSINISNMLNIYRTRLLPGIQVSEPDKEIDREIDKEILHGSRSPARSSYHSLRPYNVAIIRPEISGAMSIQIPAGAINCPDEPFSRITAIHSEYVFFYFLKRQFC
jgi:hypothetical protein